MTARTQRIRRHIKAGRIIALDDVPAGAEWLGNAPACIDGHLYAELADGCVVQIRRPRRLEWTGAQFVLR